jgi:archaellum component FlaF (FlaF/FlaG flagellin family)
MEYFKIGDTKVSPTLLLIALIICGAIFISTATSEPVEFIEVEKSVSVKSSVSPENFMIDNRGYVVVNDSTTDINIWDYMIAQPVEILNDSIYVNESFTGLTILR